MRTDFGPQLRGLLGDWSGDGAALGFALIINDDCSVVLAIQESSVGSSPGSSLSDDDSGVDFLSEFLHSLLAGSEDDVSDGSGGESVETASDALHCDDHEVFGA
jgi:hypothetical protein